MFDREVLVVTFTSEEWHLVQAVASRCLGYVDRVRPLRLPRLRPPRPDVALAADG